MRRRLYRMAALVLAPLLTTACPTGDTGDKPDTASGETGTPDTGEATDYGIPPIRYILSGTVSAEGDGSPIPGIELQFQDVTASSNETGVWSIDASDAWYCGEDCRLQARDVDADKNGLFEDLEVTLAPTQTTGEAPDEGTYEQTDVAVVLTPIPQDVPLEE